MLTGCNNSSTVEKLQSSINPKNVVTVEHKDNMIKNITIDVEIPNSILSDNKDETPELFMEPITSDYNAAEGVTVITKYNDDSVSQNITIDASQIDGTSDPNKLLESIDFDDFEQFKKSLTTDDRYLEIEQNKVLEYIVYEVYTIKKAM